MNNYAPSGEWLERALKVTPGAGQTSSKSPGRVGPLGAFPLSCVSGRGCRISGVDWLSGVDTHVSLIDWFNGTCSLTLGYPGQPDYLPGDHASGVLRAVIETLTWTGGPMLSLPHPLEATVAEKLVEAIPCAEQVRFVKTGSESCEAAIRLARIHGGETRTVIVCGGGAYHGWHSWAAVMKGQHPGVPEFYGQGVRTFDFDDPASLEAVMGDDVAAVMVEPAMPHDPGTDHLIALKDIAHDHGALLIFDEMICGGRLALAGAQERYGVTPDLACYGKGMSNGWPVAFVCGPTEVMSHAAVISSTYGGDLAGLAALSAVLDVHQEVDVIGHLDDVGRRLIDGINGIMARLEFGGRMTGFHCRPRLEFVVKDEAERVALWSLFQQELAERGVLTAPGFWNPSLAHDDKAVNDTLRAVEGAIVAIKGGAVLRGEEIRPAMSRPT